MPGRAIDLAAVALDLPPAYLAVAKLITRYRDITSIYSDILQAIDRLQSVEEAVQLADRGVSWAQHAAPALIFSAVISYVRATKSESRHRSTLDIRAKLTPTQLELHKRLCALRDDAFAHYGPGEVLGARTWQEQQILVPLDNPQGLQLIPGTVRLLFHPEFVQESLALCRRALLLTQKAMEEREAQMVPELMRLTIEDETFRAVLQRNVVDLRDASGGHLTAIRPEERSGLYKADWSPPSIG